MASNHHTDEVFTQKRKPKNPIKFNLQLNDEQKEAKALILENPIVVLKGMAGSGKTLVAVQAALDMLFTKEIEKIIITRPTVSKEDIGFLPGDLKEKMDPWLAPIYANLYMLYNKETIDKMIESQTIEILPFTFVRGRTFVDAMVIVDECQNVNGKQTEMIVGRLGINSRMVFCGDTSQIDLKSKKDSGIDFFKILEARVEGVKVITLLKNHRNPIVPKILDIYREYES
jgi:phosphate starvation-inducible PhoH-like protein